MRLLLDENTSSRGFRQALISSGHDVEIVTEILSTGMSDGAIAAYAMRADRTLVTRDQNDFQQFYAGHADHPGLVVIHIGSQEIDPAKLAKAIDHIAAIYQTPVGLVLSLADFFW